MILNIIH